VRPGPLSRRPSEEPAPAARRYLHAVTEILSRLADEEADAITAVGDKVAAMLVAGARLFVFGCGHSALSAQEIVYRAGGLMLVNPLLGPGIDGIGVRPATLTTQLERLDGYGATLVDAAPLASGDILIVVSLSGRNAVPVQAAKRARDLGVTVVAVTSSAYRDVTDAEPGRERLADVATFVLDTKVPYGDAVLQAPEVPQPFGPASGVAAAAVLHALVGGIVEGMLARGETPPVFLSANLDGGWEWNQRLLAEHQDRIFYLH
jgi:uncharacterized phosphosugar-binding protein